MRESWRERIYPAVVRLWAGALRLKSRVRPAKAARWSTPGRQKVLVIAPHPDDETIGCGGAMLLHALGGDRVCLAIVTDGRQSRALGLPPEQMAAQRRQEARAAAAVLEVADFEWLGLPEGEWTIAAGQAQLSSLLATFQPDVVYAPSRVDFHPQHQLIAHAATLALEALNQAPQVRVYQIQVPLTAALVNLVADTSPVATRVAEALACYETQRASLRQAVRTHGYTARQYGLAHTGEGFWQMPAEAYILLHREEPASWSGGFRGMRSHPISDPLAYLVGRQARHAYRSAVAQRFSSSSK